MTTGAMAAGATRLIAAVDIGSTYTKGALFDLGQQPRFVCRAAMPTTQDDLPDGFEQVLERVLGDRVDEVPCYVSSSARGGLAIAAIGIVPELTVQAARMAAASAGGRIAATFAYRLSEADVARLEAARPDIVLLTGGSDGGNERYPIENAQRLARSRLDATILYAGNAAAVDAIRRVLAQKRLVVTSNLMPQVGCLETAAASREIQDIFLRTIVDGKGLARVAARAAAPPKPTPRAVYDLLAAIDAQDQAGELVLVDLGGATTDVYSLCDAYHQTAGSVLRGLPEPRLKRSVEGDLGLRPSAPAVAEAAGDYINGQLNESKYPRDRFRAYTESVARQRAREPQTAEEHYFDRLLAGACIYRAMIRHAGTVEECYTADGKVRVQRGKDLRCVSRWIGSGGYLAGLEDADWCAGVLAAARRDAPERLLPRPTAFYRDAEYLFPLLGSLASKFPREAACLARQHLRPINPC